MISAEGGYEERIRTRLCAARQAASKGETASILFGGDPGVFSSSWRALEPSEPGQTKVHISPGVGAFSAAASRVGAPLVGDFALLSGRDDDTPDRVSRLAEGGFAVVVYNQNASKLAATADAASALDPERPFSLVQDATRPEEMISVGMAADLARPNFEGLRCTLILAGPKARITDGRIITRRGYQTKYDY